MKKKQVVAGLTAILLCAAFIGCQNQQKESSTGSSKKSLVICVDTQSEPVMRELAEAWERLNEGTEAKLVVIPSDNAAAETKITELRTEIMSGGGPDIFVLQCANPNTVEEMSVLFPNPEKAMYSDIFLPLDEYMEEAQYINPDGWNQTILDSGRTNEGQMLLPLYYEYYAHAFRTADLESADNIPSSWDELISCKDTIIMNNVGTRVVAEFYDIFGEVFDYQNETLLLSKEDLLTRTKEAILYARKSRSVEVASEVLAGGRIGNVLNALEKDSTEEHTIFAFPNIDGDVTANVTMYAAINRNTKQPQQAFALLDILFSDDVMCNKGFQIDGSLFGCLCMPISMGISLNNEALQLSYTKISDADMDAIQRMNRQIQSVRYHSDMDRKLVELYANFDTIEDEGKQNEWINQVYNALQMKLSE